MPAPTNIHPVSLGRGGTSPWQFSLRALFLVVLWCAIVIVLRPVRMESLRMAGSPSIPKPFDVQDVLYFALGVALLIEGVLLVQAMRARRIHAEDSTEARQEAFGVVGGHVGMLPPTLGWGLAVIDGSPDLMATAFMSAPIVLITGGSLILYWGIRENPTLLAQRIFTIVFNVIWAWLYFALVIVPQL